MKKILTVLLCASLALLAGCTAEETSSTGSESEPDSSVSQTGEGSSETEESPSETEEGSSETEAIDPAVEEMMEALAAYQPGTAGSSLKAYIAACGVLNYAESYDPSMEETLRRGVETWLAQADEITLECLQEGRDAVAAAAAEILAGSEESRALLSDAGSPNRYETYHSEQYDEVDQVLQELLDEEFSAQENA